jgi:cytochrome P450
MTLTYLFWELAKHPEWQKKIRDELHSGLPNAKGASATYGQVMNLPMLEAVVQEALRLHPAAPASLPRETPRGGKMLNDIFIPEKTVVSVQCYTTQRSPQAFPNPDTFDPTRWLSPQTEAMKEMFMPFSKGPRACLGKGMALMELKLVSAALLRDWEVRLGEGCTEQGMVMVDHFLIVPKAGKCELIFNAVEP